MADTSQYDHEDKLLDHEYDGIQEYDNPLPTWWKNIFWVTIVFSVLYAINIGPVGSGPGWIALYERDVAAARAKVPPPAPGIDLARLTALARDPEALEEGRETYQRSCAACHRADGGGLIGPNLTDAYWLHGGRLDQVLRTVEDGVLPKGMPAWGKVLTPEQLAEVVAYVGTLGQTPARDGKGPEGTAAPAATATAGPGA